MMRSCRQDRAEARRLTQIARGIVDCPRILRCLPCFATKSPNRKDWGRILDIAHTNQDALAGDVIQRAVEMFVETLFPHVSTCGTAGLSDEMEQLFLLHTGGLLSLSDARDEFLVGALICLNAVRKVYPT